MFTFSFQGVFDNCIIIKVIFMYNFIRRAVLAVFLKQAIYNLLLILCGMLLFKNKLIFWLFLFSKRTVGACISWNGTKLVTSEPLIDSVSVSIHPQPLCLFMYENQKHNKIFISNEWNYYFLILFKLKKKILLFTIFLKKYLIHSKTSRYAFPICAQFRLCAYFFVPVSLWRAIAASTPFVRMFFQLHIIRIETSQDIL